MEIKSDVPLAPYTTFHIGGPARFFAAVTSEEDMQEAIRFAKEKNLEVLILGGGSNMLINDRGFDGLVIKVERTGLVIEPGETAEEQIIIAEAGESWDALVERAVNRGLWGIENLSGIPGTVGGAVVQNIGAYGSALSQTLLWVEVYDPDKGVKRLSNEECRFGYRDSIFKHESRLVIVRAALKLSSVAKPDLSYKDLTKRFEGQKPSLESVREAVLAIRKGKFPDLSRQGTAGSFFKNPIVSEERARALQHQYPGLPIFDMPETSGKKIPLAWLFDNVLKLRGFSIGGARLYEQQLLVIATQKNSSSHDVVLLAEEVMQKVKKELAIDIYSEVKII